MICSRCLYTDDIPGITFNDGVCSACQDTEILEKEFPTGIQGLEKINDWVDEMKLAGKGKKYDCVIGVSGGCDSSYLLHFCHQKGLRILAVHFDNTWNSAIASMNIYKVLKKLNIDLYTYVVHNELFNDMARSMILAGVPEIDAISDIAITTLMYQVCEKFGIKYIVNGHSFRTEGFFPLGWFYFDGKYIMDIHHRFGTIKGKFPHLPFWKFLKWTLSGIKRPRFLYHLDYDKESVKEMLKKDYGWIDYGGHHHENSYSHFHHWYNWYKFGIDSRIVEHSALMRYGAERKEIRNDYPIDIDTLERIRKRLNITPQDLRLIPRHTYKDYKTYHKLFKFLKPLFYLLYKSGRVPKSFYRKYCE